MKDRAGTHEEFMRHCIQLARHAKAQGNTSDQYYLQILTMRFRLYIHSENTLPKMIDYLNKYTINLAN